MVDIAMRRCISTTRGEHKEISTARGAPVLLTQVPKDAHAAPFGIPGTQREEELVTNDPSFSTALFSPLRTPHLY